MATKSKKKGTISDCPNCGSSAVVTVHEGDIQPTCDDCGWTVDNVIRFPSPESFLVESDSFEEQYSLIVNEHEEITYVSVIGQNGRVLYHTDAETRQGALQKTFTAVLLRRFK